MHIGFCGMSLGVSQVNVGDVYIAVLEHCRMYGVAGTGTGQSVVAGSFQSSPYGGLYIRDQDGLGRQFPDSLDFKQVRFGLEGFPTMDGQKRMSILIQDSDREQRVLYEWSGMVTVRSTLMFDFDVDGQARTQTRARARTGLGDALVSHITYRYLLYGERVPYGRPTQCLFQRRR